MRALHLDFQKQTPATRIGYGLIVAGGLAALLAMTTYSAVRDDIERYREEASLRANQTRESSALPRGVGSERGAIDGARAIVAHLASPWESLFRALEEIKEPNVALLALTPDVQKHRIRIYAEARNFDAMLSYYRALERSRALRGVVLVEHEIQHGDPQKPVRFSMTAAWGEGR